MPKILLKLENLNNDAGESHRERAQELFKLSKECKKEAEQTMVVARRKATVSKRKRREVMAEIKAMPPGTIFKAHFRIHLRTNRAASIKTAVWKAIPVEMRKDVNMKDGLPGCVSFAVHHRSRITASNVKRWLAKCGAKV